MDTDPNTDSHVYANTDVYSDADSYQHADTHTNCWYHQQSEKQRNRKGDNYRKR